MLFRLPFHLTITQLCYGQCRFAALATSANTLIIFKQESPSPSTSAPPSPRSRPSTNLPEASSPLPLGVFSFYWKTGGREFDCIYKHIRCDDDPQITPPRPKLNLVGNDAIAPILTKQGLEKINGIATRREVNVVVADGSSHSRFKRFLSDTFRFKISFDVYSFLVPLSSASCHNYFWVCIFLSSIISGYLFRIRRQYGFLLIITTLKTYY